MKTLLTTLTVVALTVSGVWAQSLVETYNYASGAPVGNQATTGTGQTGTWGNFVFGGGTIGGSSNNSVAAGSLSAPSGYAFTPSNNRATFPATGPAGGNGMFGVTSDNFINFDSDDTYYISFLESHSSSGFAFDSRAALQLRDNGNNTLATLGMRSDTLTIDAGGSSVASAALDDGIDRLMVFRIDASSSGNDIISASFFDAGGSVGNEPLVWDIVLNSVSLTGQAEFVNLFIGSNAAFGVTHTGELDEIRFGATWGDVVPEPTSAALLFGGMSLLAWRRRRS